MSKVVEQLKDKLADASQNMTEGHDAAVADDPMSMLDEVEEKESPTKRMRYATNAWLLVSSRSRCPNDRPRWPGLRKGSK